MCNTSNFVSTKLEKNRHNHLQFLLPRARLYFSTPILALAIFFLLAVGILTNVTQAEAAEVLVHFCIYGLPFSSCSWAALGYHVRTPRLASWRMRPHEQRP